MTFRTTSATRRRVVSRSSEVAMTSATSSNSGSTCKCFSCLLRTEPIDLSMIAAVLRVPGTKPRDRFHQQGNQIQASALDSVVVDSAPESLSRNDADVGEVTVAFGIIQ